MAGEVALAVRRLAGDARVAARRCLRPIMLDFTKQSSPYGGYGGYYSAYSGMFSIASGDDSSHALLIVRRASRTEMTPIELEADRAPVEIHRADGEPFVEIDAITRAAGRWFIATPPPAGATSPVTTIWQVDGAVARELVRVSRAAVETGRPTGTQTRASLRRSRHRARRRRTADGRAQHADALGAADRSRDRAAR